MAAGDDFNTVAEVAAKWCSPQGSVATPNPLDFILGGGDAPLTNRFKCIHTSCASWRWYDYPDATAGTRRGFCGRSNLSHGVFPKRRGTVASLDE